MENSLTDFNFFSQFLSAVEVGFRSFAGHIEKILYSNESIHFLAVLITALIVVSLFFLIAFIFTKGLFILSDNKKSSLSKDDNAEDVSKESLESELQKELEMRLNETEESENTPDYSEKQVREIPVFEEDPEQPAVIKEKAPLIELDWVRDKNSAAIKSPSSQNQNLPIKKNLKNLLGMIVNMVGRGIDELKIAQALNYRMKEDFSEESVLQLVASVQTFLNLCQEHRFDKIRQEKSLPSEEDCILRLIAGDTSYAMALIEALMDEKINQGAKTQDALKRNQFFKEASEFACCFGTLAEVNDTQLATASFELALEMNPENTLAWSRCADLYKMTGQDDKANIAYQNVLKIAQQKKYFPQQANAYKFLSQYYWAQGNAAQASLFYKQSKNYYDSIGINRPLDRKEIEILEILDKTPSEKILQTLWGRPQNHL